jgi:LacI family transcriptional regulator
LPYSFSKQKYLNNYIYGNDLLMGAVNIKQLAQQLGLSISTVSRALNDSYDISPQTRKKVLELAKKLNYQPNPHASSLRRHNSKTIAVVVPEIANNFFALAINGIQSAAREKGYHVLIYVTNESNKIESESLKHLQNGRVDGLLISVSNKTVNEESLLQIQEQGIPLVFFDRVRDEFDTAKVTTDDFESGYKAAEHLIQQGCRKIAYLQISKSLSIGMNRMNGYLEALKKFNLPHDKKLVIDCVDDKEKNYASIEILLKSKDRPDGIFASVEHLAITSYQVCRNLKLNIPKDVKIISFSNLEAASLLNPSLTTVTQPAFDIGKEAATILLKALTKKGFKLTNSKLVLPSRLIPRESTAKA